MRARNGNQLARDIVRLEFGFKVQREPVRNSRIRAPNREWRQIRHKTFQTGRFHVDRFLRVGMACRGRADFPSKPHLSHAAQHSASATMSAGGTQPTMACTRVSGVGSGRGVTHEMTRNSRSTPSESESPVFVRVLLHPANGRLHIVKTGGPMMLRGQPVINSKARVKFVIAGPRNGGKVALLVPGTPAAAVNRNRKRPSTPSGRCTSSNSFSPPRLAY